MKTKGKVFTFTGVLVLALFVVSVFAAKKIVLAKRDGVKVYQNKVRQLYEKPIYTARKDEYMEVLSSERELYKVQLSNGKVGFVEKRFVTEQSGKRQAAYVFDDAEVQGWLDNPQAVYILDMTDPNFKPISLNKSFADQIEENVDREESEESHGMYRPKSGAK
jgi:hypothetical protein